jgi:hypothetical protein
MYIENALKLFASACQTARIHISLVIACKPLPYNTLDGEKLCRKNGRHGPFDNYQLIIRNMLMLIWIRDYFTIEN